MKKKNLKKLAKYLEENVSQDMLDMGIYRANTDHMVVRFYTLEDCGTVGCALGWSPFAEGLETIPEDYYTVSDGKITQLAFERYSTRMFELENAEWSFLFESAWVKYDNSVEGAVDRIRWLVKKGNKVKKLKGYDSHFPSYNPCKKDVKKYCRHA